MSINKFGQALKRKKEEAGPRGQPGVGFVLTAEKNYDMQNKRLTKVGEGIMPEDAVNYSQISSLETDVEKLKTELPPSVSFLSNQLATEIAKIENNALYVDQTDGNFYAKKKQIKDVAFPRHATDASTKVYVDRNCLMQDDQKIYFNATNKPIRNLSEPTLPSEAATMKFVQENCFQIISFHAKSPMAENDFWFVNSGPLQNYICTSPGVIKKAVLYSSDPALSHLVRCKIGTHSFLVTKNEGEHSTFTIYETPTQIEANSIIAVETTANFDAEDVYFQLDFYVVFGDILSKTVS